MLRMLSPAAVILLTLVACSCGGNGENMPMSGGMGGTVTATGGTAGLPTGGTGGSGGTAPSRRLSLSTIALPLATGDLTAMWGTAENDLWVASSDGQVFHISGEDVDRWDVQAQLIDMWGFGNDDVWVAAKSGPVIRIASQEARLDMKPINWGSAIWGASPDAIWFFGGFQQALLWNGETWLGGDVTDLEEISAVWGEDRNSGWAAGRGGLVRFASMLTSPPRNLPSIPWKPYPLRPGSEPNLNDIHGLAGNAVWTVSDRGEIFRFDGSQWTEAFRASAPLPFQSIWAASAKDVWAVGDEGLVAHLDDRGWRQVDVQMKTDFLAVWVAPSGQVWIGGKGTVLLRGEWQ